VREHTLWYRAIDKVGNMETPQITTLKVEDILIEDVNGNGIVDILDLVLIGKRIVEL
jgi:hypothetical protein